jgi:hypothetical protein
MLSVMGVVMILASASSMSRASSKFILPVIYVLGSCMGIDLINFELVLNVFRTSLSWCFLSSLLCNLAHPSRQTFFWSSLAVQSRKPRALHPPWSWSFPQPLWLSGRTWGGTIKINEIRLCPLGCIGTSIVGPWRIEN